MPALLLMAVGCDGDEAEVAVRYVDRPALPRELLSVTLSDGRHSRTLTGSAIGGPGAEGQRFTTRRQGTLRIAYRFASGSTIASEGAVELPLRADWRYGVDLVVDTLDPTRLCFGCLGVRAFPIAPAYRPTPRDSVWVVWGGNSIRNPVVY